MVPGKAVPLVGETHETHTGRGSLYRDRLLQGWLSPQELPALPEPMRASPGLQCHAHVASHLRYNGDVSSHHAGGPGGRWLLMKLVGKTGRHNSSAHGRVNLVLYFLHLTCFITQHGRISPSEGPGRARGALSFASPAGCRAFHPYCRVVPREVPAASLSPLLCLW